MMNKVILVLRTAFLVFILYYAISATPVLIGLPSDFGAAQEKWKAGYDATRNALWLSIAWIALETAAGWWWTISRRSRPLEKDLPKAGSGEPPFAPPR
ncbi:MAG TPA: hypothetical protein VML50_17800 [Anaeromyxobacter sp.]|nr:hypothetical protein [Anaeromyxobacter sp.]